MVHKPRRDADTHFEFKDDGTPDASRQKPTTNKGRQHNAKGGLYKDHVLGDEAGDEFDTPKGDSKGPLNDITHIKNDIRKKDFGAHWEMKDDSPGGNKLPENKLTQNQQKVLKTMDANWSNYEPSPQQSKIKIAGNGMVSTHMLQWSVDANFMHRVAAAQQRNGACSRRIPSSQRRRMPASSRWVTAWVGARGRRARSTGTSRRSNLPVSAGGRNDTHRLVLLLVLRHLFLVTNDEHGLMR